jgi:hypothetical protein
MNAPIADLLAPAGTSEAARVRLGAAPDTAPDILRTLARDPSVTVRAAVAMNPAAGEADHLLAQDQDERIRTLLARKLATLVPNIAAAERDTLRSQVMATLHRLVSDEAVRVRRVQHVDDRALVVALHAAHLRAELGAQRDEPRIDVRQRVTAIHGRLARAEAVEVRAVHHEDTHHDGLLRGTGAVCGDYSDAGSKVMESESTPMSTYTENGMDVPSESDGAESTKT